MKKRLKEAKDNHEKISLMLIYPKTKPIFMTGYVLEVFDDSFKFNDRINGPTDLGLEFLENIRRARK